MMQGLGTNFDIENEVVKVSLKREEKKKKVSRREVSSVWKPRFIHEVYSQEQLLRNAVAQEHLNRYSLVEEVDADPNDQHARAQEEDLRSRRDNAENT